jgi:hypothetical protein
MEPMKRCYFLQEHVDRLFKKLKENGIRLKASQKLFKEVTLYNLKMRTLIVGALMCLIFSLQISINSVAYSQEHSNTNNDLIFDVQNFTTSPVTKNFNISGDAWKKLCPSNQCQIEEKGYDPNTGVPEPEDTSPTIHTIFSLDIHDYVTNKDLTPLQKKFVESYTFYFSCGVNSVKDIIEQANNTIYKCEDYSSLSKTNSEENDEIILFTVKGTYDTKNDTLNATGVYNP